MITLCAGLLGCAADPSELAPTEALTAFLAALERSTHAPDQRKLAYDWLDLESQKALQERARLSSSLSGRPFEPWEMLVPGRLSFAAQSLTAGRLSASIDGEHATVTMRGADSAGGPVPMVRESGRWRVMLPME
ncbi:MAG: hypothetical protein ABW252_06170 [Polyangiales bacterium]